MEIPTRLQAAAEAPLTSPPHPREGGRGEIARPGRLRCWLIGSDSLLSECGEILLRGGHQIQGVVAPSGRVADWAESRSIQVVDPADDYGTVLTQHPFDHLFAITHVALVPDRVLRMPERSAINFHDGPLPDYAGLNAPVCALLHGESRYGITWHLMTSVIDGGAIVRQKLFDVAPDETALSLNTKCFDAALETFGELVEELAAQTLRPEAQEPRRRPAIGRHHRPAAACVIDWTRPAAEIEALVRALHFGRYLNPVGSPKIHRARRAFAVTEAKASEGPDVATGAGDAPPACGMVLSLDEASVVVATGRGTIALRGFTDLLGKVVTPQEVARSLELEPGVALDTLAPDVALRLTELDQRMSRGERAWVRRLSELDPLALPVVVALAAADATPRPTAIEVVVPQGLAARFAGHPVATVLIAAFCAFLSRLARSRRFDVGYRDVSLRRDTEGLEAWVVSRMALHVEVDPAEGLAALIDRVAADLSAIRRRGPWLHDAIARHPVLHALRDGGTSPLLPMAIECCVSFEEPELPAGTQWTLELSEEPAGCRCVYDARLVSAVNAESLQRGFAAFLAGLAVAPMHALATHDVASGDERERQLREWNATARPDRRDACLHDLVAEQVRRTPDATAVVCDGRSLTYAELHARSGRLASRLRALGVRRGQVVGVCVERSLDLTVAILGTLAAAAAYLPLDPAFPAERLAFMVEDSEVGVIITQASLASSFAAGKAKLLLVDADDPSSATTGAPDAAEAAAPGDLAYVIYTSGSTGRPKGVLVEHRNVASFFAAMDDHVAHERPGVWLAVTSTSFDISVLELLWTLSRGFKVILHSGRSQVRERTPASATRAIDFSLFFFSGDESHDRGEGYRLLLEGARFADANGFRAVWTPERHFHPFGGLYPNPAVIGAAIAAITGRVGIRAGSVVLPLHHPIRVAEEWALVDNLSGGRVAISFASGWHPDDFVLAPQNHATAKAVLFRDVEIVRRLWRGEVLSFPGVNGAAVLLQTRPRPVQAELPVWITSAGSVETFEQAGRIGANVLTHLLGQSIELLAPKIVAYRAARAAAGFDAATGVVTLMLHTFVGEDEERVQEQVREPLERYLSTSLSLIKDHAASFPAFPRDRGVAADDREGLAALAAEDRAALVTHAAKRYVETSGLFGTPERCRTRVDRLREIGVDEIACLIDFGVPVNDVLASLPVLDRVRRQANTRQSADAPGDDTSIAGLIRAAGVTHLQCTPSMARVLCSDPESRLALRSLDHLFVGGEALPEDLAASLTAACGAVTNLYGPTETTIWSSTHRVASAPSQVGPAGTVPIGRPIANTSFYVLDEALAPLPIGVAGELFIGGHGVARGYLRRPELDAQRFLPDPFASVAGARMYRTGDLVRYRADGVVEFLGRTDQQVKVRGHRIEPGEIESLIAREPSVVEAVVVAREDVPGDQRLVAYVVARSPAPDPALLRERLSSQLPAYMVPSQIVFLDRIPRTPNRKIDRGALPPCDATTTRPSEHVLPATELEMQLSRLWQSVLGIARVGVEENFFDIGGHSVLAVRIHRKLQELTSTRVSLTDLFRFPTIRSLARFLTAEAAPDQLDEASLRGRRRRRALHQLRPVIGEA